MKRDEYISGPHHSWTHFVCGLIFGAGAGFWIGWNLFDTRLAIITATAAGALLTAFGCGRWGDTAWQWIIKFLCSF